MSSWRWGCPPPEQSDDGEGSSQETSNVSSLATSFKQRVVPPHPVGPCRHDENAVVLQVQLLNLICSGFCWSGSLLGSRWQPTRPQGINNASELWPHRTLLSVLGIFVDMFLSRPACPGGWPHHKLMLNSTGTSCVLMTCAVCYQTCCPAESPTIMIIQGHDLSRDLLAYGLISESILFFIHDFMHIFFDSIFM